MVDGCINFNSADNLQLLSDLNGDKVEFYRLWLSYDGVIPDAVYNAYKINKQSEIKPIKSFKENEVNFVLKSIDILSSDKAKQVFEKGKKANWDLNKTLSELQIPKEQKQLILDSGKTNLDEIITDLLANYSYSIEINTAKTGDNLNYENIIGQNEEGEPIYSENTQHYSNLTVPGGTNYTENEIATPAITPSIKGHANFATDKGIGWFRSDEQMSGFETSESEDPFGGEKLVRDIIKYGSKTRRILEVQSDLFQKGRDKEDLTNDNQVKLKKEFLEASVKGEVLYNNDDGPPVYKYKDNLFYVEPGRDDETGEYLTIYSKQKNNNSENQFLQLLNKDSNWVTFFVKSIIQDSAKKGYEKVLFPTGNTASKVEGHSTLEEYKKNKQDALEKLEERKLKINNNGFVEIINSETEESFYNAPDGVEDLIKSYKKEDINKEINIIDDKINQIKKELINVEGPQGFGALKPIYNFYENTVTNILKKQGYQIEVITDEYGNNWNEVEIIKSRDLNNILLQKTDSNINQLSANDDTLNKMYQFAKNNNVSVNQVSDLVSKYGANGLTDAYNYLIQIQENKNNVALTEEVAHIFVELLPEDSSLLQEMKSDIINTQIYKDTLAEYKSDPNYRKSDSSVDFNKIKKEAIGKLIAEHIINRNENIDSKYIEKSTGWFNAIIDFFKKAFNIKSAFEKSADSILTGNKVVSKPNIENTLYYKKIDKAVSYSEQKEILDSLMYSVYGHLKIAFNFSTIINLEDIILDNELLNDIKDSVKLVFQGVDDASVGNQKDLSKSLMKNFDEYFSLALVNFNAINFKANIDKEFDIEEANQEDGQTPDKIYSKSLLESDIKDTLYAPTKFFLNTVPEVGTQTIFGLPRFADFNDLYTYLKMNLVNLESFDDMVNELESLKSSKPELQYILDTLLKPNDASDPDGSLTQQFRNNFYTSFKNNEANLLTVFISDKYENIFNDDTKEYENVKAGKSYTVVPTNKRSLDRVLLNKWFEDSETRTPSKVIFKEFKEFVNKNFQLINNKDPKAMDKIVDYLGSIGITTNRSAIMLDLDYYVADKDNKNTSYASYLTQHNRSIGKLIMSFHDDGILFDKNEVKGYNTTIKRFANITKKTMVDVNSAVVLNGENKQVYTVNLSTFATDHFDKLLNNESYKNKYLMDEYYSNMVVLKPGAKKDIKQYSLDTLFNNNDKEGITYTSMTSLQMNELQLNLFLNNFNQLNKGSVDTAGLGVFIPVIPADRANIKLYQLPRVLNPMESPLDENGKLIIDSGFYKWLVADIKAEYARIKRTVDDAITITDDKQVLNYDYKLDKNGKKIAGNAYYFNSYPFLNKYLYPSNLKQLTDINPSSLLDKFLSEDILAEILQEEYKKIFQNEYKHLLKNNVIKHTNINGKKLIRINSSIVDSKLNNLLRLNTTETVNGHVNFINSYIANSIYALTETTKLEIGDLAQYKVNSNEGNFTDANKRAALSHTPGSKLMVNTTENVNGGIKPTFTLSILEDVEVSSDIAKEWVKMINDSELSEEFKTENNKIFSQFAKDKSINKADAQGFCSLDRYSEILNGQGLLTSQLKESIKRVKNNIASKEDINTVFQPIKGFYNGDINSNNRIIKFNLKYSLVPIIPQMVSADSELQKFIDSGIDEFVFQSGVKMGIHNLNTAKDIQLGNIKSITLNNVDYRIPQVVPYKDSVEMNMGTQLRDLITANSNDPEKVEIYQNLLNEDLEERYQKVAEKMSNLPELVNWLQEQLKSSNRALPDMMEEAVQIVKLQDGTEDTLMSLGFPSIKKTIEAIFMSGFRNKISKMKIGGMSAVQVSTYGRFGTNNKLKYIRPKDNKWNKETNQPNEVEAAEVEVSPQYFINILKKQNIDVTPFLDDNGNLNIDKIPKSLRQLVIYRIPTQGFNSMLPAVIKSFTTKEAGSIIYLPDEFILQSGSDFDIDKVYIEIPHVYITENNELVKHKDKDGFPTTKGRQNQMIDYHYSVLTDPANFMQIITPNSVSILQQKAKEQLLLNDNESLKLWQLPSYQEGLRLQNKDAKQMVSVWSMYSTAIPLLQYIEATTNPILVEDDLYNQLVVLEEDVIEPIQINDYGNDETIIDNNTETNFEVAKNIYNNVLNNFSKNVIGKRKIDFNSKLKNDIITESNYKELLEQDLNFDAAFDGSYNYKENFEYWLTEENENTSRDNSLTDLGISTMKQFFTELIEEYKQPVDNQQPKTRTTKTTTKPKKEYFPLSRQKSIEGEYLTEENSQVATASVDGVKEPLDGILNINDFSSPLLSLIQKTGLGLNFAIDVINTKLFRELTGLYYNQLAKSDVNGRTNAIILSLEQMENIYGTKILGVTEKGIKYIPETTLKLSKSKLLKAKKVNDFEVLKWAISYFGDADALNNFILNSQSKKGLNSNITDAEKQIEGYESIIDNVFSEGSLKFNLDKLKSHSNYGFYKHGMKKPMNNIISKVFVDTKPFIKHVSRSVIGNKSDPKLKELVKGEFLTYLFSMPDNYLGKTLMDSNKRSQIMLTNNTNQSVARRFNEYFKQQQEKKKQNSNHIIPRFINYFTTDFKSSVDKLNFMNSIARSLDSNIKSQIADEIWDLYEKGNNFERQLAEDMVLYNFLVNGFDNGADAFTNFIHTKFYVEWGINNNHKGHEQILRQDLSVEDYDEFYDVKTFKDKFIRNNYKRLAQENILWSFGDFKSALKSATKYKNVDSYMMVANKLHKVAQDSENKIILLPIKDKAIKSYYLREDEDGFDYISNKMTMEQFKEQNQIC